MTLDKSCASPSPDGAFMNIVLHARHQLGLKLPDPFVTDKMLPALDGRIHKASKAWPAGGH